MHEIIYKLIVLLVFFPLFLLGKPARHGDIDNEKVRNSLEQLAVLVKDLEVTTLTDLLGGKDERPGYFESWQDTENEEFHVASIDRLGKQALVIVLTTSKDADMESGLLQRDIERISALRLRESIITQKENYLRKIGENNGHRPKPKTVIH